MSNAQAVIPESNPTPKQMRKDLLRLSWPCAIELMLSSAINMFTMMLVSSIGAEAVSAVGITTQPIMIPQVLLQAFAVGGTAVIARSLGEKKPQMARLTCEQMLLLSAVISVVSGAVMVLFGGYFIKWMGATDDYYDMALLYMKFCSVGVVFQSITSTIAAVLRGAGRTRLSMRFSVIANIVNVAVGLPLIRGIGFIPSLGIMGAGIAALTANIVGCVLALLTLFRSHGLPVLPRVHMIFKPNLDIIQRISRIGVSSSLEQLALRVGLILFTMYVVHLGTAEYAAHNIAGSIHGYVVNVGSAFAVALVSLVGQNLGAKRPDVAERYFAEAIKLCALISVFISILLLIFPYYVARLFTPKEEVIANIIIALRILAFFVPAQIIQIAVCGGLRGGGDTKWPLISTMFGVLVMRMVLGYIFVVAFQWGLAGAWFCWLLDQVSRMFIILYRYRGGKWKMVKV